MWLLFEPVTADSSLMPVHSFPSGAIEMFLDIAPSARF